MGAMAHPTPAGPGALAWLPSSLPPNVRLVVAVGAAPAATTTAAALVGSEPPQDQGVDLGISELNGCLLMRICGPLGGVVEEARADDGRPVADPLKMCVVHDGGGCRCGLLHQAMALRIRRRRAQGGARCGADTPSPRVVFDPCSTLEMLLEELGAVEAELGECGLLPDELDVVLHLLACVNGGIEESRLAYSVGFDLLKVCWVLDALEPIVIRAAGMLILMEEEFLDLIGEIGRLSGKQLSVQPYNEFAFSFGSGKHPGMPPTAIDHASEDAPSLPRFFYSALAENLRNMQDVLGVRESEVETCLRNFVFFITVKHSEYYPWYVQCWNAYVAHGSTKVTDLSIRLCVNIREDFEHYMPFSFEGATIFDPIVAFDMRVVHGLNLVEYLGQVAKEPDQGLRLLETISSENGPRTKEQHWSKFRIPCLLQRSILLDLLGKAEEAMQTSVHVLDEENMEINQPKFAFGTYHREEYYVISYIETCRVAAIRKLGELSFSLNHFLVSRRCYIAYLKILSDIGGHQLEVIRGKALWEMAQLCHEEIRATESVAFANESLVKFERELLPDNALLQAIRSFLADSQPLPLSNLGEYSRQDSTLIHLGDEDDGGMDPLPLLQDVPKYLSLFHRYYEQSEFVAAHRVAKTVFYVLTNRSNLQDGLAAIESYEGNKLDLTKALNNLSAVCRMRGLYKQAKEVIRATISYHEKQGLADQHLNLVNSKLELTILYVEEGQYVEAAHLIEMLDSLRLETRIDLEHPALARKLFAHGCLQQVQGRQSKAVDSFKRAYTAQKTRLPLQHEHLMESEVKVIEALVASNREDEAKQELALVIASVEKLFKGKAMALAQLKYAQGIVMLYFADYKGADEALREAQRNLAACIGKPRGEDGQLRHHQLEICCKCKIAEKSYQQGRFKEADDIYTRTMAELNKSDLDVSNCLLVAEINENYAKVLDKLGSARRAMALVEDALEIRKRVPNFELCSLFKGHILLTLQQIALGRLREAQISQETAEQILEKSVSRSLNETAELMLVRAELAIMKAADLKLAEQLIKDAIKLRADHMGANHPILAQMQLQLCRVLIEMKRFSDVDVIVKAASTTLTVYFGKLSPHLAAAMRIQSSVLRSKGEYDKARLMIMDAIGIDGGEDVVSAVTNMDAKRGGRRGSVVVTNSAIPSGDSAFQRKGGAKAAMTPQVAEDLEALGRIHFRTGALEAAEETIIRMYEMCLEIFNTEKEGGKIQHPMIARAMSSLADICLERGEYVDAHDLCLQALEMQVKLLSATHPHTLRTQFLLARILELCGDYDTAISYLTKTQMGLIDMLGAEHLQVLSIQAHLEMIHYRRGDKILHHNSSLGPRAALIRCLISVEKSMIDEGLIHSVHSQESESIVPDVDKPKLTKNPKDPVKGKATAKKQVLERKARVAQGKALGGAHYVTEKIDKAGAVLRLSSLVLLHAQVFMWMAEIDKDLHRIPRGMRFLKMAKAGYLSMGKVGRVKLGSCLTCQGQMELEIGQVRSALGKFMSAIKLKSLDMALHGDLQLHPETLDDLHGRARIYVLRADYPLAQKDLDTALQITENKLSLSNRRRGFTFLLRSRLYSTVGKYVKADEAFTTASELISSFNLSSTLGLEMLFTQGLLKGARGLHTEALTIFQRVRDLAITSLSSRNPLMCKLSEECAFGELACGRVASAKRFLSDAEEVSRQMQPSNAFHCEMILSAKSGDKGAVGLHRSYIERLIKGLIPLVQQARCERYLHPTRLRLRLLQGQFHLEVGNFDGCAHALQEVIKEYETEGELGNGVKGSDSESHALICECLTAKSQLCFAQGKFKEASKLFSAALTGKIFGHWDQSHLSCADDMEGLGRSEWMKASYNKSRQHFVDARRCHIQATGNLVYPILRIQVALAFLALEQGKYDVLAKDNGDLQRIVFILNKANLFRTFPHGVHENTTREELLMQIAISSTLVKYSQKNSRIYTPVAGDFLFLIGSGALSIFHLGEQTPTKSEYKEAALKSSDGVSDSNSNSDTPCAILKEGDTFCSVSLFPGNPFNVRLVPVEDGDLVLLGTEAIQAVLSIAPESIDFFASAVVQQSLLFRQVAVEQTQSDQVLTEPAAKREIQIRFGIGQMPEDGSLRELGSRSETSKNLEAETAVISKKLFLSKEHTGLIREDWVSVDYTTRLLSAIETHCKEDQVLVADAQSLCAEMEAVHFRLFASLSMYKCAMAVIGNGFYGNRYFSAVNIVEGYCNLLILLRKQQEALQILPGLLREADQALGLQHHAIMRIQCALALANARYGHTAEAEQWLGRAMARAKSTFGDEHPRAACCQSVAAEVLLLRGCYDDACDTYRRALELKLRAGWSAAHPSVANDLEGMGRSLSLMGRFDEAEGSLQRAQVARSATAVCETGRWRCRLDVELLRCRIQLERGFLEQSARAGHGLLQGTQGCALDGIHSEAAAELLPDVAIHGALSLAALELGRGECCAALALLEPAVQRCPDVYSAGHPDHAIVHAWHARAFLALGTAPAVETAAEILAGALAALDQQHGPGHPAGVALKIALAVRDSLDWRCDAAVAALRGAADALHSQFGGQRSYPSACCRLDLAWVLHRAGRLQPAFEALLSVYGDLDEIRPPPEPPGFSEASDGRPGPSPDGRGSSAARDSDSCVVQSPFPPDEDACDVGGAMGAEGAAQGGDIDIGRKSPAQWMDSSQWRADERLHKLDLPAVSIIADIPPYSPSPYSAELSEVPTEAAADEAGRDNQAVDADAATEAIAAEWGPKSGRPSLLEQLWMLYAGFRAASRWEPAAAGGDSEAVGMLGDAEAEGAAFVAHLDAAADALRRLPVPESCDIDAVRAAAAAVRTASPGSVARLVRLFSPTRTRASNLPGVGAETGGIEVGGAAYHPLRTAELQAMLLQARLLADAARYGPAFFTLQHLLAELARRGLARNAAGVVAGRLAREAEALEGLCLLGAGRPGRDALSCFRQVLDAPAGDGGGGGSSGSAAWEGLGEAHQAEEEFAEAADAFKRAAARADAERGASGCPRAAAYRLRADAARWRAGLLPDARAAEALESGLAGLRLVMGDGHPTVLALSLDLGDVWLAMGDLVRAGPAYEEAGAALEAALGPAHPLACRAAVGVAVVRDAEGAAARGYGDSPAALDDAAERVARRLGHLHPALGPLLAAAAAVCRRRGLHEREAELRGWAAAVLTAARGPDSAAVVAAQVDQAEALAAAGRPDEARLRLTALLAAREAAQGPTAPLLRPPLVALARLERAAGRLPEAFALLERSLAVRTAGLPAAAAGTYGLDCTAELLLLGEVGSLLERFREARAYLTAALAVHTSDLARREAESRSAATGGGAPAAVASAAAAAAGRASGARAATAECRRLLGSLHAHKGELDAAAAWYREALDELGQALGAEHPRALGVKAALAGVLRAQEEHVPAFRLYQ